MKKVCMFATIAFCAFSFQSQAQFWDFNSPSYSTLCTQANLDTISGITSSAPNVIAIDTDGSIICVNDPGGSPGNVIDIDPAGGTNGVIICQESVLDAAQTSGGGDLDINGIAVASDGTIYFSDYDGVDEVIKLVRTPSVVASLVGPVPGVNTMTLDEANNRLFICTETNFGGNDNLVTMNLANGTVTEAASAATIMAASGAGGVGMDCVGRLPNGNIVFFDEAAFGGSDSILQFNPGTSQVSVLYNTAAFATAPGLTAGPAVTSQGDLVFWDEFGFDGLLVIDRNGQMFTIDEATLISAYGLSTSNIDAQAPGSIAVKEDPTELIVYIADTYQSGGIYKVSFPAAPSAVHNWSLY